MSPPVIRADIERVRRGHAAREAGDDGPESNGGSTSYARCHIAALMHLGAPETEQVLVDLLAEPEYLYAAAIAMARDFLPRQERTFDRTFRYDLMWAARDRTTPPPDRDKRRTQYATALNAEVGVSARNYQRENQVSP